MGFCSILYDIMTSLHISLPLSFARFYFTHLLSPEYNKTCIECELFLGFLRLFFFFYEAEFPKFHSYSSLSEGPGLLYAPAGDPYSRFIPIFPAVPSLFQLCRASHTPLIFLLRLLQSGLDAIAVI